MNTTRPATFEEAIASAQEQVQAVSAECVRLELQVRDLLQENAGLRRQVEMLKNPREPELPPQTAALMARQEDE